MGAAGVCITRASFDMAGKPADDTRPCRGGQGTALCQHPNEWKEM